MMRAFIKALEHAKLSSHERDMATRRLPLAKSGVGSQNKEKKLEKGALLGLGKWRPRQIMHDESSNLGAYLYPPLDEPAGPNLACLPQI